MLERYEKVLHEIKYKLAGNEKIARLLTINSKDALEKPIAMVLPDEALPYIYLNPLVSYAEANVNSNQSVFISINIPTIDFGETFSDAEIKINVACARGCVELNDNKLRLYQLCNAVIDELNFNKLSSAGQLTFDNLSEIYYNKDVIGFTITGYLIDETQIQSVKDDISNAEF